MDTSETFIKMCEKAEEIQSQKPSQFDWLTSVFFGRTWMLPKGEPHLFACSDLTLLTPETIWLPRQDQLQEMMGEEWDTPAGMFINGIPGIASDDEYYNAQDDKDRKYYLTFQSWEQLWLAFVQKELHKKVWDGEEWLIK